MRAALLEESKGKKELVATQAELLRPIEELKLVSYCESDYAKEIRREVFTSMESAMLKLEKALRGLSGGESIMAGADSLVEIEVTALVDELVNCVEIGSEYVPLEKRATTCVKPISHKSKALEGGSKVTSNVTERQLSSNTVRFRPGMGEFPEELQTYLFASSSNRLASRGTPRRVRQRRRRPVDDKKMGTSAESSSEAEDSEEEGRR